MFFVLVVLGEAGGGGGLESMLCHNSSTFARTGLTIPNQMTLYVPVGRV